MARLIWDPPKAESITVRYSYDLDHAISVWAGFTRTDGTKAPARRWTDAAIAEMDFQQSFARHYKEFGNLRKAFMASAEDFGYTLKDMIQSPIWKWDRVTVRQYRGEAGLQRDAVDSGELLRSQRIEEV